jgi:hypothetical protein
MGAGDGGREVEHAKARETACQIVLMEMRYGHSLKSSRDIASLSFW